MQKPNRITKTERIYFELIRIKKEIDSLLQIIEADRLDRDKQDNKIVLFDSKKGRSFFVEKKN